MALRRPLALALTLLLTLCLMAACGSRRTSAALGQAQVQSRLSQGVFLDPVPAEAKVVYLALTISSEPSLDVGTALAQALTAKGYQVVDDPRRATFLLQANLLGVGETDEAAVTAALAAGFGGDLPTGAWGSYSATANTFMAVTDIQISQRETPPATAESESDQPAPAPEAIVWKRHRTRIVNSAREPGLTFEAAYPILRQQLITTLSALM